MMIVLGCTANYSLAEMTKFPLVKILAIGDVRSFREQKTSDASRVVE